MVRIKNRYILFNILYPAAPTGSAPLSEPTTAPSALEFLRPTSRDITNSTLAAIIRENIALQSGDYGSGVAASLAVKHFSPDTSTGILRVSREHYRIVWAALTLIRELKGQDVVVRVVRISGTMKKAEKEAIRRAKGDIERFASGNGAPLQVMVDDGSDMEE